MNDISSLTAFQLGEAFKSKKISPSEALDHFLNKIKNCEDSSIFISLNEERSKKEAEESTLRYIRNKPLGPFDGVPIAWKDLFDVEGMKTSCGSKIDFVNKIKQIDAKVVKNTSNAGMVFLGKVNLTEFAFSGLGLNPNYGTPGNAFNKDYCPGGSSSGSAVAVASGLAPIAIGTDTGGSVRIPASFNSLVGYKSSEGYIDKTGVHPLSITLDTIGPISKSVMDCAIMERILKDEKFYEIKEVDLKKIKIVVPENLIFYYASKEVTKNFEDYLSKLRKNGLSIEYKYIDVFDEMLDCSKINGTLATVESFFSLGKYVDGVDGNLIDNRVVDRIEIGRTQSVSDYISIQQNRLSLNKRLFKLFEDPTLLVMPTVGPNVPRIQPLDDDYNLFNKKNMEVLFNTMIGNFFNLPGITLPSGKDNNGLPTGILFSAKSSFDINLIEAVYSIGRLISS